jgi:hypothetical protein
MITAPRPLPASGAPLLSGMLAGALAVTLAVTLAGCGGSSGHSGQAATSPAAAATGAGAGAGTGTRASAAEASGRATGGSGSAAGLTSCQALTVTVDDSQAGAAAGSTYLPIDFANSSASACTMYGFPGVSLAAADGSQIGAAATRNNAFGKVMITLRPGESAHAWLQVADAQNYPSASCEPTTASVLRVYPPGDKGARDVDRSLTACRSASSPILTVTAVRAGKATAGTVP